MYGDEVLVLDCQGPNGLALCRTLGKRGLHVTAGGFTRFLPGMLSKYTSDSYVHPHPMDDQRRFVDHLEDYLSSDDVAAVFPVTDLTTSILSRHKHRLESTGTRVGAEDWETFRAANDKGDLFAAMADVDVPTPATYVPESIDDVADIDADRDFKVVVKPRRTTFTNGDGRSESNRISGTNYVEVGEDLSARVEALLADGNSLDPSSLVIQEFIDGDRTMATVGLADEGELLTHFQHKKFRVFPPSGGIGAVRQGVREPLMRIYAERVVEALGWTGPIHVEFMKTADDFYLLEVNGRYWGSLALTINSGVDVPWYHYQQLTSDDAISIDHGPYRTDVKQRKLFYQDLRWLHHHLSRGDVSALVPFTSSFFTTRDEFLDPDDPLPFLGLGPRSARGVANVLRGRSSY